MLSYAGRTVAFSVGLGVSLTASIAMASNGTKPRIPVDWTDAPCMTIVDRSAATQINMSYTISMEDTDITDDEVTDSRTHQFFALCRARDPQTFLPRWITQDDIDRAAAKGSAPASIEPEDVFDTSTEWADCWFRINADDDRRPITFAAADAGVDWDTSTVPADTYVVDGYTFEPAINIWSWRPGVVKVVDDPDPAASRPALAVNNEEEVINRNESVTIEGCVSTMEGSTLDAYWAFAEIDPQWVPFVEGEPVSGESFAVEFAPPEEVAGDSAMVRIDVTDPMGRSYTNYMRALIVVLSADGPGSCDDGGGNFIGGAGCEDTGGATGATAGATDGSAGTEGGTTCDSCGGGTVGQDGGDSGGPGGCACRSEDAPGRPVGAGLVLLGLLGLRRRRRAA